MWYLSSVVGICVKNLYLMAVLDGKTTVKVIAGEQLGTSAYIETRIPIMFLDIHLSKNTEFDAHVPKGYNGFAYVWRGKGFVGTNEDKRSAKLGDVSMNIGRFYFLFSRRRFLRGRSSIFG